MKKQKTTKEKLLPIVLGGVNVIRKEAADFEAKHKDNEHKSGVDWVTSADTNAEKFIFAEVKKELPEYGLISEEVASIPYADKYITCDPLDGTAAFVRKQAHGSSSMAAVVENNVVTDVIVADINTTDVYHYGPEDEYPIRTRFGVDSQLKLDPGKLKDQYVVFHDSLYLHPRKLREAAESSHHGGIFKGYEIMGGSVGTMCARLWTGEVAGIVLRSSAITPWDSTPLYGMADRLGIAHIAIDAKNGKAELLTPKLVTETTKNKYVNLMVHNDHLDEVLDRLNSNNALVA